MQCTDSTTAIILKCRVRQTGKWGSERVKAFKMSLDMAVLKLNMLSWAWAVLVLMNPEEVEEFSLAKALSINTGNTDCSLQIKTIPWKSQLQHSLLWVTFAKWLKCLPHQFDFILTLPQGSGFLIIHSIHVLLLAAKILVNYFPPKGNAGTDGRET